MLIPNRSKHSYIHHKAYHHTVAVAIIQLTVPILGPQKTLPCVCFSAGEGADFNLYESVSTKVSGNNADNITRALARGVVAGLQGTAQYYNDQTSSPKIVRNLGRYQAIMKVLVLARGTTYYNIIYIYMDNRLQ